MEEKNLSSFASKMILLHLPEMKATGGLLHPPVLCKVVLPMYCNAGAADGRALPWLAQLFTVALSIDEFHSMLGGSHLLV